MPKIQRKTVFAIMFAVVAAFAVASAAALCLVVHRVRQFDEANNCRVLAGMTPRDVLKAEIKAAAPAEQSVKTAEKPAPTLRESQEPKKDAVTTNVFARVHAISFQRDEKRIAIKFTQKPTPEDVLRYVVVSPKVDDVTVDTEEDYDYWQKRTWHWVYLKSENYKFRTPYTVTVKREMPFADGWRLEQDFKRTVERPDLVPSVSLVDSGRYLPPVGDKSVAVNVVNISKVVCAVRYVLPENIVQLLAREEEQYRKSLPYWRSEVEADSEATTEISTAPTSWEEEVPNKLNEWSRHPVRLRYENGVVSNGVYLLSVRNGDKPEGDENSPEYRLVCMTDLGISVRRDRQSLRVWVTSLTTGRPVPGVEARLYASNRLPLADAKTGPGGEAVLSGWDDRYEPFALVVVKGDKSDFAFMAIRDSMRIDEPLPSGVRPDYKKPGECRAFLWTERGIYRHGEKIMLHAVLRNGEGNAPGQFPVKARFEDPSGREVASASAVCDEYGAVRFEGFAAPDHLPSGKWKIKLLTPGKAGALLGERVVKIEEFVPPQVRVSLKDLPDAKTDVSNFTYKVAAEHLFGGPAKKLSAESLVAFADADFAPDGWKGFRFGDPLREISPNYTRLPAKFTDDNGEAEFSIGLNSEWGLPKAAVKVTIQGSVFETGGRPSVTRASRILHKYPYYIGSDIPQYIRQRDGLAKFRVVQVEPDGRPHKAARRLKAELWKVERVYNLSRNGSGSYSWDSERIRKRVDAAEAVDVSEGGEGTVELPVSGSGDYEFTVEDEELGLSHTAKFWISAGGDDEVRANLKNPTAVSIAPDKSLYREGERPRITLKTPFRGMAWLAVMRENVLYTRVFEITNLTSVVELDPVDGAWAPDVDVAVSVVQSVEAGKNHLAARAHGIATLRIRTRDSELPVEVKSSVRCADQGGSDLEVVLTARGEFAVGDRAVVTVVDEGINMLTGEQVPDPVAFFSEEHGGWHPLYDLYNRLLPVYDAGLKATGAKTGGDGLGELMNRVSPVPTRRFKPLSMWQLDVPLTNGAAEVKFRLPEFVGEVRVTAFAYNRRATGCAAVQQKVSPKLVMQPDAPRFAAPGDRFALTLALFNRSGKDAEAEYEIKAEGAVKLIDGAVGRVAIKDGDSKVMNFMAEAKSAVGQGVITYRATGCGESHTGVIELPVRPAVAWEERAEVVVLKPGKEFVSSNAGGQGSMPDATRRTFAVSGSPMAELVSAFDYLAEYPHGCLEQTTSRMFPLVYGGGFLNRLPSSRTSKASEARDIVDAGVARVVSMLRQNDFTMWPDSNCPPWDREVSVYAAHFLVEAEASGFKVGKAASERVRELLKKWAFDPSTNISAYACHTLALAGCPEKDRMFALYDMREKLSLVSRARLARAFARIGDPKRARELVADAAVLPKGVKDASFALMALLELGSGDRRIPELVLYLQRNRDKERFHWGTTGNNAHALMALAAYYRANDAGSGKPEVSVRKDGASRPEKVDCGKAVRVEGGGDVVLRNEGKGDAFVSVKTFSLPSPDVVTNEHNLVRISRRFMTSEGFDVDLGNLTRGELLIGEITLESDRDFDFTDLVVQDLFPACLEPDRKEVADAYAKWHGKGVSTKWVLRSDVRDDRVLVFSRPVSIKGDDAGQPKAKFFYAVRVITPGDFVLPGARVEAMYAPEVKAQTAPSRISVKP